jgi:hypothetical protein
MLTENLCGANFLNFHQTIVWVFAVEILRLAQRIDKAQRETEFSRENKQLLK